MSKGKLATIPCCLCGASIQPNTANMCTQCLKGQVDVTVGISKQENLLQCKTCFRFKGISGKWLMCAPESHELLALCLKQISGLGKGKSNSGANKTGVSMVDATWIWTEPHSRRLKVRLVLEKEVVNGAMVRQSMVTEFVVRTQMCTFCSKENTDQQWNTVVQVRQKVDHKRTLLYLEQMILSHGASSNAFNMDVVANGMDFYYTDKNQAVKFAEFVQEKVPAKQKESKKLQSHDQKSNKAIFKFNISIEIVPICKFDLVILPKKLQGSLFGSSSALVLCHHVARALHFVDPENGKVAELREGKFWNNIFRPLSTATSLVEFVVLDVDERSNLEKELASDVEVALASDFGVNDRSFLIRSHISHLLSVGDTVLGYDLVDMVVAEEYDSLLKGKSIPQVVLVKKKKEKKRKTKRQNKRSKIIDHETAADVFGLTQNEVEITLEEFEELELLDNGSESVVQVEAEHSNVIETTKLHENST